MGILTAILSELPAWILVSLGFYVAYRVLKFPDLTVDASFVAGTAGTACAALAWHSSILGLVLAVGLGIFAGLCTGFLYFSNPRPAFKLLASVLVLLAFYSVNYRVLGHRVAVGFSTEPTAMNLLATFESAHGFNSLRPLSLFISAGIVIIVFYLYSIILRSDFGLMLRSIGTKPWLVSRSNFRVAVYLLLGLGLCNGTVALGGWLYASGNSFSSVNVFGTIMHALAAALLGEAIIERVYKGPDRRVSVKPILLAPFWGAIAYQILRASCSWVMTKIAVSNSNNVSINAQDFNTVVAIFIILLVILVRWVSRGSRIELIGSGPSSGEGE